uniref:Uncharacterized protein n=1 Tax=Oryza rufipogon TaxID=4529 RepID=A0A0E0P3P9_ORYRU
MAESPENAAPAAAPAPAPAPTPAPPPPPSSPPTKSGIPPRYDLDAKWDACLDISIRRVAYSTLGGTFAGLLLFRGRQVNAVWLDRSILMEVFWSVVELAISSSCLISPILVYSLSIASKLARAC